MNVRFFAFSIIVCCSCDNIVRFETPQPDGQKDEKVLPKKLIGSYRSLKDSSILTITKDKIISSINSSYSGLVSDLDSIDRVKIKNDTSYSEIDFNMRVDVSIEGDSIFQHFDYKDTIFSFSKNDVLRKFKGYYFLNRQTSPNHWYVTKLGRTKEGLVLGIISSKEDIRNLRELTNINSDTIYEFRPTKKDLKQFLKEKGFQNEERYVKIERGGP